MREGERWREYTGMLQTQKASYESAVQRGYSHKEIKNFRKLTQQYKKNVLMLEMQSYYKVPH